MTMTEAREWPHWEQWEFGWDVVDGHLHFENESIGHLLPPHLIEQQPEFDGLVPRAPNVDSRTRPRNWLLRFQFENGWEAIVYPQFGLALNGAAVLGVNRRLLGPRAWPFKDIDWENESIVWQDDENDAVGGSQPELDDPTHLLLCLAAIAALPSSR